MLHQLQKRETQAKTSRCGAARRHTENRAYIIMIPQDVPPAAHPQESMLCKQRYGTCHLPLAFKCSRSNLRVNSKVKSTTQNQYKSGVHI